MLAEIEFERCTAALRNRRVVIVLDIGRVADCTGPHNPDGRARRNTACCLTSPGRESTYAVDDTGRRIRSSDVVNITGIVLIPSDQTHSSDWRDWNVDESLRFVAIAAVPHVISLHVVTGLELRRVGLIGNDADRAGLGARSVESALRTLEHFDTRDVID